VSRTGALAAPIAAAAAIFPAAAIALAVATTAAADPVAVRAALEARGFENVAVDDAGAAAPLLVYFENRVLRDELAALGAAAWIAAAGTEPAREVTLIPQERGVPLLGVTARAQDWTAFLSGRETAETFRRRVRVVPADADASLRSGPASPRTSSSRWRTDVRVRPLFDFQLGVVDDPFRSAARLAPELLLSPARGLLLTGQLQARLHDGLDPSTRDFAPGRSTLSWGGWLPGGWLAAASAGLFAGERWGTAGEIGRLSRSGRLEIRAGGDWSGLLEFRRGSTFYSDPDAWSAFVAVTGRTERLDLEVTVTGARFLEGDTGYRADVERRFHEAEIGFFLVGTRVDKVLGVSLRLPLPGRRWSRPAPLRVTTVPAFPFEYRDSLNEIGQRASLFDDLDRLRRRLYPTFVRNNLDDLRRGMAAGTGR
jgi:hypothetical protein